LTPAEAGGKLSREEFVSGWQQTQEANEGLVSVEGARIDSVDVTRHKMQENKFFFAAKKGNTAYFTGKTVKSEFAFVFLVFEGSGRVREYRFHS
jgi:hypothetical protein